MEEMQSKIQVDPSFYNQNVGCDFFRNKSITTVFKTT